MVGVLSRDEALRHGRGRRPRSGRDPAERAIRRSAGSWISASSSSSSRRRRNEAKKKQKQVEIKEVKFRPVTDEGDYQIKLRNMRRFLEEGDKVKVTIRFRGREMSHQELGREMADADRGRPRRGHRDRARPRLEGRQMVMMIAPKKKTWIDARHGKKKAPFRGLFVAARSRDATSAWWPGCPTGTRRTLSITHIVGRVSPVKNRHSVCTSACRASGADSVGEAVGIRRVRKRHPRKQRTAAAGVDLQFTIGGRRRMDICDWLRPCPVGTDRGCGPHAPRRLRRRASAHRSIASTDRRCRRCRSHVGRWRGRRLPAAASGPGWHIAECLVVALEEDQRVEARAAMGSASGLPSTNGRGTQFDGHRKREWLGRYVGDAGAGRLTSVV